LGRYATHFFTQIEELKQQLSDQQEERSNRLKNLYDVTMTILICYRLSNMKKLMSILYATPTTLQPALTPQAITHTHHKLENVIQRLTSQMDVIIRDRATKLEA
jgi:hypothetical protein